MDDKMECLCVINWMPTWWKAGETGKGPARGKKTQILRHYCGSKGCDCVCHGANEN